MDLDLAVLGNLILDDVVYADGATRMAQPGGAVLYAALGARLWGVRVGVVAPVGNDYPRRLLDELAARGVELGGLRDLARPGLRTWLLYEGPVRRVVHRLEGPTHLEASPGPEDLPEMWECRAYHVAPTPGGCQRLLLEALAERSALVSLDPYELFDAGSGRRREAWRRTVRGSDVLFVGDDEVRDPAARAGPRAFLESLCGGRLARIFWKRGAAGGIAWSAATGAGLEWEPAPVRVLDPTGAGDAFAGGVLAGLLAGDSVAAALECGVVSASFALEDIGAEGLLTAGPDAAGRRRREWFGR